MSRYRERQELRTLVSIPIKRIRNIQTVLDNAQRGALLERIELAVGNKYKLDDCEPEPIEVKRWRKWLKEWEKKRDKKRNTRWALRTRQADKVREQILFAKSANAALAAVVKFERETRRGK